MRPGISIIVCTYNRADDLSVCLKALSRQTLGKRAHEVIIVDNNSTDRTADLAQGYCEKYRNFKYVFAPKQGLAHARNVGMRSATFPIALFTDDDAVPPMEWAQQYHERFLAADQSIVCIGGEIEAVFETPRPIWLSDELMRPLSARLGWSDVPRLLGEYEWPCEVNSAYRVEAVMDIGGFPEELGRIGTNLLSGENAINAVLAKKGFTFYFDPEIVVKHKVPASRLTKEWFRRRYFWQGITSWMVRDYLAGFGIDDPIWSQIAIPADESAWSEIFSNSTRNFEEQLSIISNLGYIFASQNCIGGR